MNLLYRVLACLDRVITPTFLFLKYGDSRRSPYVDLIPRPSWIFLVALPRRAFIGLVSVVVVGSFLRLPGTLQELLGFREHEDTYAFIFGLVFFGVGWLIYHYSKVHSRHYVSWNALRSMAEQTISAELLCERLIEVGHNLAGDPEKWTEAVAKHRESSRQPTLEAMQRYKEIADAYGIPDPQFKY